MAFAGGVNCEVWMGLWEKAGGGKAGDKGAGKDAERVSLGLVASIPLIWFFAGSFESASATEIARESAQGLAFANALAIPCSYVLPAH